MAGIRLSRKQLAAFLKTDHEAIRQFETVLDVVDSIAPNIVSDIAIAVGSADAKAQQGLDMLSNIETSILLANVEARAQDALDRLSEVKKSVEYLESAPTVDMFNIQGNASTVTVVDAGSDTTTWPMLATSQTGNMSPATDSGLTYNASTNALSTTTFIGALQGNADTVTTNANLTGPITSVGNATSVASQTGTGSTFVMSTAPTVSALTISANATIPTPVTGTILHVVGAAATSARVQLNSAQAANVVNVIRTEGTMAAPTATASGAIFALAQGGFGDTGAATNTTAFQINAAATWTDTSQPSLMTFRTTPVGATSTSTRMTISSTGMITFHLTDDATSLSTAGVVGLGGAAFSKSVMVGNNLVLPKTSGYGIKVDTTTPTFPWHDIIGTVIPKTTGAGTPTFGTYRGNINGWKLVANDIIDFVFHIPHDYVPGSDIYFHVHWSHNGTAIVGNAVFTQYATYAKGHNQAAFPAEITNTITYATVDIATTPQYQHRVDEVQFSTAGGTAAMLNTTDLEPDGVVLVRMVLTTLPTITGGDLFVHTCDIHYQSTNIGTKAKAPGFWT